MFFELFEDIVVPGCINDIHARRMLRLCQVEHDAEYCATWCVCSSRLVSLNRKPQAQNP